ncbi:sporulation protein [Sphingomonas koreensis]|jgi:cell division septation protein DedD|uniref:Sporulation protein n=1 Tax=Sphingomonas koreensis TaxID=93064 RepID=A0A1L6JBL0_9SPHN|nr:SPOR domain-containing protein [Sphingomonas koreensis]APR53302.1 sporulation protein [Sphingomonas koreensis]MDC7810013.1 SPOR domain-containing protein [Sphingomonas koreensis]RSU24579.1 sporulation protein [Sphingomonas koreensis]RSU25224.1 sporulation protein [Sphingomonas koreensis]RSU30101.1 sporulation protein [Sphingomonas koreensis]
MRKISWAILLAAAALPGAPALADVKAGVDAWQRGDYKKALAEWRGPAAKGDADAQFNLGQAYKLGRGVPVDLATAEEWYRKAALQGHPQAEESYGLTLFENNKRAQAAEWLQKAASRGEQRAQYVLGTMYFNGDGVERDWVRAYALTVRAAAQGMQQASSAQAQMDRHIALADRQKGLELARQYERDAGRPQVAMATPPPVSRPANPAARTDPPARPQDRPLQTTEVRPAPPIVRPAPRQAAPAPQPAPARPAAVRDGGWKLQLGAFGDPGNARRLGAQMSGRFPGRQISYVKAGKLTRVLVGPFASNAEASGACRGVGSCVPVRN